jgi:hypothetical protein
MVCCGAPCAGAGAGRPRERGAGAAFRLIATSGSGVRVEATLRRHSFQPLVVVELSATGARIPVVRAVVPGCSEFSHRRLWQGRRIRIAG